MKLILEPGQRIQDQVLQIFQRQYITTLCPPVHPTHLKRCVAEMKRRKWEVKVQLHVGADAPGDLWNLISLHNREGYIAVEAPHQLLLTFRHFTLCWWTLNSLTLFTLPPAPRLPLFSSCSIRCCRARCPWHLRKQEASAFYFNLLTANYQANYSNRVSAQSAALASWKWKRRWERWDGNTKGIKHQKQLSYCEVLLYL